MGADDLDNIEVAIAALAVAPALRVVLRAGEDDVIAETRSLFRIGQVCDVSALTAHAVTLSLIGNDSRMVFSRDHEIAEYPSDPPSSALEKDVVQRCACVAAAP